MSAANREWKVLPHGRPTEVDDGILTVVGELRMPLTVLPRRMTLVRLRDARLVVYSAIALDAEGMARIESYGRPAYLVVPNEHHRLDAPAWKARYPDIQVVAPAGCRTQVQKVVAVDSTAPAFGDAAVDFVTVAGTADREVALVVRTARGTTLVVNDIVGNLRNVRGLGGRLLALMGFAGDVPRIPRIARLMLIKDAKALQRQLRAWSEIPSLIRMLVSHGDVIDANVRRALDELAASLGG